MSDSGKSVLAREIWNYAIAATVYATIAFLVLSFSDYFLPKDWNNQILFTRTLQVRPRDIFVVSLLVVVAATLVCFAAVRITRGRRKFRVVMGRESVMVANLELLTRFARQQTSTIWSTRVTHWELTEQSIARVRFRNFLSERIHAGYNVQRLWQITSENDVARFLQYWEPYSKAEGYSAKVIFNDNVLIPDLCGVDTICGSISMPGPSTPSRISTCFHYESSNEVAAIRRYFEVLWDKALPIKVGNQVYEENLAKLRLAYRTEKPKALPPPPVELDHNPPDNMRRSKRRGKKRRAAAD